MVAIIEAAELSYFSAINFERLNAVLTTVSEVSADSVSAFIGNQ